MTSVHENINKTRSGKRVLVAPLDWGLGHATRCIPVIHELQRQGFDVFIAAEKKQADLLRTEFPRVTILDLKGYNITYSKRESLFFFHMLRQAPKILRAIKREHQWLEKIIDTLNISLVISDNRFGMHSNKVPCIFITHQLFIKTGDIFSEKIAQSINRRYLQKFDHCWVPDDASENNLAGNLSHPRKAPPVPVTYIGPLTRFRYAEREKDIDLLFLISGPEPQRTVLETLLSLQQRKLSEKKIVYVLGLPGKNDSFSTENCISYNHLPAAELNELILRSKLVVSRSGYSTVMDLAALRAKAIFIPTPGQTEQEYLAKYLSGKGFCMFITQQLMLDFRLIIESGFLDTLKPLPVLDSCLADAISTLL